MCYTPTKFPKNVLYPNTFWGWKLFSTPKMFFKFLVKICLIFSRSALCKKKRGKIILEKNFIPLNFFIMLKFSYPLNFTIHFSYLLNFRVNFSYLLKILRVGTPPDKCPTPNNHLGSMIGQKNNSETQTISYFHTKTGSPLSFLFLRNYLIIEPSKFLKSFRVTGPLSQIHENM